MNIEDIKKFCKILIKNNKSVSKLEFTKNNFDNRGRLIKEELKRLSRLIFAKSGYVKIKFISFHQ